MFRRRLAIVFVVAFLLRVAVRAGFGVDDYWSNGYTMYKQLADSLVAGHGYAFPGQAPTAFRVPLYPLLVAAVTQGSANPWPLIAAQAAIGATVVVVTGLIARRLYGLGAGTIAAIWCAIYPLLVLQSTSLEEIGLLTLLAEIATGLLLVLVDRRSAWLALAAGVFLGAALLTRSALAPFVALALVWLVLPDGRATPLPRRLGSAALVAAATLAVLSPWLERSHRLVGSYALGTENGISLYRGASPLIFSRFPRSKIDDSLDLIEERMPADLKADRKRYAHGNDARESRWYARQAIDEIEADPGGYWLRNFRKLAIALGPRYAPSHGPLVDLAYAAWWLPLLVFGLVGAWRDSAHWRRNLLLFAQFAGFVAVTWLIWAQTVHRAYLDVYLMILAAPVLLALLPRAARRWLENTRSCETRSRASGPNPA